MTWLLLSGILHLLPGLQHQMGPAGLVASDLPYPLQTQLLAMDFQPSYGTYDNVYAQGVAAQLQAQSRPAAPLQRYAVPVGLSAHPAPHMLHTGLQQPGLPDAGMRPQAATLVGMNTGGAAIPVAGASVGNMY